MVFVYIMFVAVLATCGFLLGFIVAAERTHGKYQIIEEELDRANIMLASYRVQIENSNDVLKEHFKAHRTEKAELAKNHCNMLSEISQVVGIEVVELPSFGTVYLNQEKIHREALLSISMEE